MTIRKYVYYISLEKEVLLRDNDTQFPCKGTNIFGSAKY